jgi:hypothetical protein|eukprot:scaffold695_cov196-Alexandrium_tamarense.AAC.16
MNVLDATHKSREDEFAKQRDELASTKEAKDAEIHELRVEILNLKARLGGTSQQQPREQQTQRPQPQQQNSISAIISEAEIIESLKAENTFLTQKLETMQRQVASMDGGRRGHC